MIKVINILCSIYKFKFGLHLIFFCVLFYQAIELDAIA